MMFFKALMLAAGFALAAGGALPDEPKDELAKASEKTRGLENYKFKGKFEVEGVPFLPDPVEYNGAYVKDQGFTATLGPVGKIFRIDKKVAIQDPDSGEWVLSKAGRKVGEGPLAAQIPVIARSLRPPHEELKKIEERFKAIKKRDGAEKIAEQDCAVYEGDLTEAGVKAMLPGGALLGPGTYEGRAQVWVNPDGKIVKYKADCKMVVKFNENEMEIVVNRTTELTDLGKAKVEMPDAVKKLFDADDEESKKEGR